MNYRKANDGEINGTSYQGLIKINYTELCKIFGQPEKGTNDGKIQAQWELIVAGGAPVVIYDYKEDVEPRNVLVWHIGGRSKDAVQLVEILIKEYRKANK